MSSNGGTTTPRLSVPSFYKAEVICAGARSHAAVAKLVTAAFLAVMGALMFGISTAKAAGHDRGEVHQKWSAANARFYNTRHDVIYRSNDWADRVHHGGPVVHVRVANVHPRRGYRRGREIVFREVIPARGRARIVVTEEIIYRRRGRERVCTVSARGPERDFIRRKRLRRVARNYCSRRASIRIVA
ncbi:MAG: hypothetical protein AAF720_10120 [Pseudomonadota bacterium]